MADDFPEFTKFHFVFHNAISPFCILMTIGFLHSRFGVVAVLGEPVDGLAEALFEGDFGVPVEEVFGSLDI